MNYIFDFDGTICDSFEITIEILNKYLAKLHKPLIDGNDFRKKGIEEVIHDYKLNKLQILLYVIQGRRELAKQINELTVFPAMTSVIKQLSISNHLGIVSSNSKANINKVLKSNKLESYFDFIYSSPTIFEKSKKIDWAISKYKLNKKDTIYIGDEVRDIQAAHKIDLKCISVSWGFASRSLLKESNPDFLIFQPKELLSVEKQLQH